MLNIYAKSSQRVENQHIYFQSVSLKATKHKNYLNRLDTRLKAHNHWSIF